MRPLVSTTNPCITEQRNIAWCSAEQAVITFDAFTEGAFDPTRFGSAQRAVTLPDSLSRDWWATCEPVSRRFWVCVIAAMFSACNSVPAAMQSLSSVAPSSVVNTSDIPSATLGFHKTSADSCPSGVVIGFDASDVHDFTVKFRWHQTGTPDMQVEIERRNVTNAFTWAGSFVTNQYATTQEWHAESGGVYRARIRTRSCGDHYGPWGDWVSFGVDDWLDAVPNGSGDSQGSQGGAASGNNAGDGVGSGANGGNTSDGGSNASGDSGGNLGGSGNGGSCPNGGSGDHNGDGHSDCGIENAGTPPGQQR